MHVVGRNGETTTNQLLDLTPHPYGTEGRYWGRYGAYTGLGSTGLYSYLVFDVSAERTSVMIVMVNLGSYPVVRVGSAVENGVLSCVLGHQRRVEKSLEWTPWAPTSWDHYSAK